MECNIGKIDRIIRFIVGLLLFFLGMLTHLAIVSALGLLVFLTAVTRFCFFYKLFKLNTNCSNDSCNNK